MHEIIIMTFQKKMSKAFFFYFLLTVHVHDQLNFDCRGWARPLWPKVKSQKKKTTQHCSFFLFQLNLFNHSIYLIFLSITKSLRRSVGLQHNGTISKCNFLPCRFPLLPHLPSDVPPPCTNSVTLPPSPSPSSSSLLRQCWQLMLVWLFRIVRVSVNIAPFLLLPSFSPLPILSPSHPLSPPVDKSQLAEAGWALSAAAPLAPSIIGWVQTVVSPGVNDHRTDDDNSSQMKNKARPVLCSTFHLPSLPPSADSLLTL